MENPIKKLYTEILDASKAFDAACVEAGYKDGWDAYEKDIAGHPWPDTVVQASDKETKSFGEWLTFVQNPANKQTVETFYKKPRKG